MRPEPITLLSALAAITENIGVGGTISSPYAVPYTAVRMLANIDHISGGRAAWNLVTSVSDGEARNYGRPSHYSHKERYERAGEFIEVVQKLWDSWGDESLIQDVEQGIYADSKAFNYINHQGKHFDVKGPINIPRPPQGQPVLIQAGVSESFIDLAAKNAEVIFVVQPTLERAKHFYGVLKEKARSFGRDPDSIKILPSVSDGEARNYGRPSHYSHKERYERAGEFIEVVQKLWDSWGDEALIQDVEQGIYADSKAFNYINHQGKHFDVKGPINIPRPPQGQPVLIQAGVSESFIDLAAKNAEVIFVVQPTLERAKHFYGVLKEKARSFGRDPDSIKILPGIVPVVAETHDAAVTKDKLLKSLIRPEAGLSFMSASMNFDLSQFPQDSLFPDISYQITGSKGRFQYVIRHAIENRMTVAEVGKWYAESLSFFSPVGSPEGVAEQLETWYREGACDGFVILPPYLEADSDLFLEGVVPQLQKAGVFRKEYPGTTLRGTLGLTRPHNRYTYPKLAS